MPRCVRDRFERICVSCVSFGCFSRRHRTRRYLSVRNPNPRKGKILPKKNRTWCIGAFRKRLWTREHQRKSARSDVASHAHPFMTCRRSGPASSPRAACSVLWSRDIRNTSTRGSKAPAKTIGWARLAGALSSATWSHPGLESCLWRCACIAHCRDARLRFCDRKRFQESSGRNQDTGKRGHRGCAYHAERTGNAQRSWRLRFDMTPFIEFVPSGYPGRRDDPHHG
jgi:hypothetical protein